MEANTEQSELELFHRFIARRLTQGHGALGIERSVHDFREYGSEFERFIEETQPALEQCKNGESKELDIDALMKRVERRLVNQKQAPK